METFIKRIHCIIKYKHEYGPCRTVQVMLKGKRLSQGKDVLSVNRIMDTRYKKRVSQPKINLKSIMYSNIDG